MRSNGYHVMVWCQVGLDAATDIKPIRRILRVCCSPLGKEDYCKASASSHGDFAYGCCTHGSLLLQAIRNLMRPKESTMEGHVACTAQLCRCGYHCHRQPAHAPFERLSMAVARC